MYWFFPEKNAPVYQCLTLGTFKNLFFMCGGRSSILHYGPLIETNYLYVPTPNGQSPSASLNKSNNPHCVFEIYLKNRKPRVPFLPIF